MVDHEKILKSNGCRDRHGLKCNGLKKEKWGMPNIGKTLPLAIEKGIHKNSLGVMLGKTIVKEETEFTFFLIADNGDLIRIS